jgi:hypothetical protein
MVVLVHRRREGGKALTSVRKPPHHLKIGTDQNV